jgi:aminoglycoside phosphotransferase family enzyme/predicted kinase
MTKARKPRNDPNTRYLVEALKRPSAYDHDVDEVRVAETHISFVFLTGRYAYKIKKPIKLPFLDFSALEQRRHFCEEELRLNARLAPGLYLGVVPIGGTERKPRVGAEPAIEYAVKMRQFADDARLDRRLADAALPDALRAFGAALADFHDGLPRLTSRVTGADALAEVRDNLAELSDLTPRADLDAVRDWVERAHTQLATSIDARSARGRYRECHGDLHLENLLMANGKIVAFDALEFDAKLREIDVVSEAAFVVMDLCAHDRADLGYVFLCAYLERGGDYDGLSLLRFHLVQRALVRAKVRAIKARQKAAEPGRDTIAPYVAAARGFVAERRPLLVITHGLSGSGKTYVTDALIGPLRAVRARSDVERKRLAGLAAAARTGSALGAGIYDRDMTERTYAKLAAIAATALGGGFDAIVDATFLTRAEREPFRALAERLGARFAILHCDAPEAVLRERVAARESAGRDASEAGLAVLEAQLAAREPLGPVEASHTLVVGTEGELDAAAIAARLANA